MARALSLVSLLALLSTLVLAALLIVAQDLTRDLASLQFACLYVADASIPLFAVAILLAVVDMLWRRSLVWVLAAAGLVSLGAFAEIHSHPGWFLPLYSLDWGLEAALLPAAIPLLTLAYAAYSSRHPRLRAVERPADG